MAEALKSDSITTTRRGFFKMMIAACNGLLALSLAVPGAGFLLTPIFRKSSLSWVKIGPVEDFASENPQKATFKYVAQSGYSQKEKNAFVWVIADTQVDTGYRALSAVCSHTGCNVSWKTAEGMFVCPCHEGRYDAEGNVISGPPPAPLTRLPVRVENGQLQVQLTS